MADPVKSAVNEYEIPFAKALPEGVFTPEWVDWESKPACCFVIPDPRQPDQLAKIVIAEGFQYVDAQGNPDRDGELVFGTPQNVKLSIEKLRFDVLVANSDAARQSAKKALKNRSGEFHLKVKLRSARQIITGLQNVAIPMAGVGAMGGAISGAIAGLSTKSVPARGAIKLRLEHPKPVIWSEAAPAPDGTKRVTVDTADTAGTSFPVCLWEYKTDEEIYKRADETLEQETKGDFAVAVGFKVQVETKQINVKSERLIVGDRLIAGKKFLSQTLIATLGLTRRPVPGCPKPLNEPFDVPVYYQPAPTAKLALKVFMGGKEIHSVDELPVNGERVPVVIPALPMPSADATASIRWKVVEPSRAFETDSGFITVEKETTLEPVANPDSAGTQCAGVTIDIVANPLTQADLVKLTVKAPPVMKVRLIAVSGAKSTAPVAAGACVANADGECIVVVSVGSITRGGEPYTGGVKIRFGADRYAEDSPYEDAYFVQKDHTIGSLRAQEVRLLCKLHFDSDDQMRNLPLAASGGGRQCRIPSGAQRVAVFFDDPEMDTLFPDGISPEVPLEVTLRPSKIKLTSTPDKLPGDISKPEPLFTAKIMAQVFSADGHPISKATLPEHHVWRLRLEFAPSAPPYADGAEAEAINVDENGYIRFRKYEFYEFDASTASFRKKVRKLPPNSEENYYTYNHEQWCWNSQIYELSLKTASLVVFFGRAGGDEDRITIDIKESRAVYVCFDGPLFVASKGTHTLTGQNSKQSMVTELQTKHGYSKEWPKGVPSPEGEKMTVAEMLKKWNNGEIPQKTVITYGTTHAGIVEGRMIRHFLQSLGMRQYKPLNRDQLRRPEHNAATNAEINWDYPRFYMDDPVHFLERNTQGLKIWALLDRDIYLIRPNPKP